MNRPFPLEPDEAAFRAMVDAAMERIADHLRALPDMPAHVPTADNLALARRLIEPLPETGAPFDSLLHALFDEAIPASFTTPGPGYLAYIPGGGLLASAVADLIADSVNRYVGVFAAAPALAQIEANVVRWFNEIVGYPPEARGILTTGGSLANLSAIVTARRERLPRDFLGGTIYTSDQVHHCVTKAAILAGFPPENVRLIESDEQFRVRVDRLERAIDEDRRAGMTPFMVVGSAGTTNTGAVDDLVALNALCKRESLWHHVDGAYGGFFALTSTGRDVLRGLGDADSMALDPHKALFLPYGTGCLLVRDGDALRRAHALHAEYLPAMQEDPAFVDFNEYSPELSRDFRGLRVWLPLKLYGAGAFRDALDEKLALTAIARDAIAAMPDIEIVAEPQLTVFAFRLRRDNLTLDEHNALNQRLLDRINAKQRVFLTPTTLAAHFVIRVCILCFRTHEDRVHALIEDVNAALTEV